MTITNIQAFSFTSIATSGNKPAGKAGEFDALLASFDKEKSESAKKNNSTDPIFNANFFALDTDGALTNDPVSGLIDQLFSAIQKTLQNKLGAPQTAGVSSFFTSEFQSVFGTGGGPLFDFINKVTAERGLSPEQNLALQNIAINNKDAVQSPETIDKIGKELRAAGIA